MLDSLKDLFSDLHEKGISYCIWKSNEHLDAALEGKTDVDILVAESDRTGFVRILADYGFRQVISPSRKSYSGVEDFLGLDQERGALVHFHVHYRLVLGSRFSKSYELPLTGLVLRETVLQHGVRVPRPEIELLLLTIRANMKMGRRAIVKFMLNPSNVPYPASIVREFSFLLSGCDGAAIKRALIDTGLPIDQDLLLAFLHQASEGCFTRLAVLSFRLHVLRRIEQYRTCSPFLLCWQECSGVIRNCRVIRKLFPARKKRLGGDGKVYAFVGADGSGKSTVVREIAAWLAWKLDVKVFYFGIPKSGMFRLASTVAGLVGGVGRRLSNRFVQKWAEGVSAVRWAWLAKRRLRMSQTCRRLADKGCVIVTDRYPAPWFEDMSKPMDGPRIRTEGCFAGGRLHALEEDAYNKVVVPDMVFVLQASLEVLRKRKSDTPPYDIHSEKVRAVNSIGQQRGVTLLNVDKGLDSVLLDVKHAIWRDLQESTCERAGAATMIN